MKIAILADSHAASLRLGWDRIASHRPDVELRFFAQRRYGLEDLRAEPGRLVAGVESLRKAFLFTSDGFESVEIADFDAILVYGLSAAPFFRDNLEFHSRQVLERACQDLLKDRLSLYVVILAKLAGASKVYVGHDPLPLEGSLSVDPPRRHYIEGLNTINEMAYHRLGAELVAQPEETTNGKSCTLKHFTQDARRLSVGDELDNLLQPKHDRHRHMNAEFGALWLGRFLDNVQNLKA